MYIFFYCVSVLVFVLRGIAVSIRAGRAAASKRFIMNLPSAADCYTEEARLDRKNGIELFYIVGAVSVLIFKHAVSATVLKARMFERTNRSRQLTHVEKKSSDLLNYYY